MAGLFKARCWSFWYLVSSSKRGSSNASPDADAVVYHTDAHILSLDTWEWRKVPDSLLSSHSLCSFEGGSDDPATISAQCTKLANKKKRSHGGDGDNADTSRDKEAHSTEESAVNVGERAVVFKDTAVVFVGGGSSVVDAQALVKQVFG